MAYFVEISRTRHRGILAATFALSLLATAASLYAPFLSKRLVDDVILRGNWAALCPLLLTMVLYAAAGMVLGGVSSYLYTRGASKILVAMRVALFDHLERAEMRFFGRTRVGEIVARLNNDMVEVRGFSWTSRWRSSPVPSGSSSPPPSSSPCPGLSFS